MTDGRRGIVHRRTKNHYIVGLACTHVLIFYSLRHCPEMDEHVWCFRCGAESKVIARPILVTPEPESTGEQLTLDVDELGA